MLSCTLQPVVKVWRRTARLAGKCGDERHDAEQLAAGEDISTKMKDATRQLWAERPGPLLSPELFVVPQWWGESR
jgi:hypothetical protein